MNFDIRYLASYLHYSLYHVKEITSTNTYLKIHYAQYPDNTILIADHQSQGRGRYNRIWVNSQDICFSLLSYQQKRYEIISPVAVMKALRSFDIPAFIKWPNDIIVDDKKICGILIEDVFLGSTFQASIIGIGINMTSKDDVSGIGVNDYSLVDKRTILETILKELSSLENENMEEVMKEYKKNNLIYNRKIEFENQLLKVFDFTKDGYLVCLDEQGREVIIKSDEINIKKSLIN